jgi:8-oxo-dGTP pyrophosphatase MutT (NUDIX family)
MTDRVAAVILLRRDGAALLQHRDDKPGLRHAGMWVPPGGHVESCESMLDCARRELREETEYDASDLRFLLSFEDTVEGWPAYRLDFFWCWYDGVQTFTCHEGQALAFVERAIAASYPIPTCLVNAWDAALAAAGATMEKLHA